MSIRCAVCGSKCVTIEVKNEGFNKKKGFIGIILFGLPGVIMGSNRNKVTYYHCDDCGSTLNYTMSSSESELIDECIMYPRAEYNILIKKKVLYPNIEWPEENSKEKRRNKKDGKHEEKN